ncbi:MAG: DUF1045 domain-containing protein [Roseicyclus sp.]
MDRFKRYGLYVVPDGAFYDAGAAWLGWDSVAGRAVPQPRVAGLDAVRDMTATPGKYGFHGTIKPPFRLVAGQTAQTLDAAARSFCTSQPPVVIPEIEVRLLGRFVAVVCKTPSDALARLAGATVRALDPFRAPAPPDELQKRRAKGLSPRQDALLTQWGYPYVMEEFRFHLTLTGNLPGDSAEHARTALASHFAPHLPRPYVIDSLALMGEAEDGFFHLVHRYTLSG